MAAIRRSFFRWIATAPVFVARRVAAFDGLLAFVVQQDLCGVDPLGLQVVDPHTVTYLRRQD